MSLAEFSNVRSGGLTSSSLSKKDVTKDAWPGVGCALPIVLDVRVVMCNLRCRKEMGCNQSYVETEIQIQDEKYKYKNMQGCDGVQSELC